MSTMIFAVYDALKEAGATEEKARKAAEALAAYENRFNRPAGDLNLLKWMVGYCSSSLVRCIEHCGQVLHWHIAPSRGRLLMMQPEPVDGSP